MSLLKKTRYIFVCLLKLECLSTNLLSSVVALVLSPPQLLWLSLVFSTCSVLSAQCSLTQPTMVIIRVYYLLTAQRALVLSTAIWFISLVVFGTVCANNGNDADSNLTCVNRKL